MSAENFIICDRCGDSERYVEGSDAAREWCVVWMKSLAPSPFSFFKLMGGDDDDTSGKPRTESWHVCPKCIEPLSEWFTSKVKEAKPS